MRDRAIAAVTATARGVRLYVESVELHRDEFGRETLHACLCSDDAVTRDLHIAAVEVMDVLALEWDVALRLRPGRSPVLLVAMGA